MDEDIRRQRNRRFAWIAGGGCLLLALLGVGLIVLLISAPITLFSRISGAESPTAVIEQAEPAARDANVLEIQGQIPTMTAPAPGSAQPQAGGPGLAGTSLEALYQETNAAVVSIQVIVSQQGQLGAGAGSGFIIDDAGHIVTNNHVVEGAQNVTVIAYDGTQIPAEVLGTDPASDLAVLSAPDLPDNTHPIPLGDSDAVRPGQWVIAIGNPFGLSSSVSAGIVSATGRAIPSGATPYQIPQVIQTDAAINPGNSGGPLINMQGEVIGVNAQIRTSGAQANAGVGFAIPSNIVRRVIPVLIEAGRFEWAWLGVQGGDVTLTIAEANNLETQQGAYIAAVVDGGPADRAGLQGADRETTIDGLPVLVGGDVIVEAAGQPVRSFTDLLTIVANHSPGDSIDMTVLRDGETFETTVELAPRPANVDSTTFP